MIPGEAKRSETPVGLGEATLAAGQLGPSDTHRGRRTTIWGGGLKIKAFIVLAYMGRWPSGAFSKLLPESTIGPQISAVSGPRSGKPAMWKSRLNVEREHRCFLRRTAERSWRGRAGRRIGGGAKGNAKGAE